MDKHQWKSSMFYAENQAYFYAGDIKQGDINERLAIIFKTLNNRRKQHQL